jgi:hypothetical protein
MVLDRLLGEEIGSVYTRERLKELLKVLISTIYCGLVLAPKSNYFKFLCQIRSPRITMGSKTKKSHSFLELWR